MDKMREFCKIFTFYINFIRLIKKTVSLILDNSHSNKN
jgi:hypothetical protein